MDDGRASHQEVATLTELAELVKAGDRIVPTAEQILLLAQSNLECDLAGITVRRGDGRLDSIAVTGPLAAEADALQHSLGEGPCVGALDHDEFASEDLSSDPRWPSWGPKAAGLGLRSLLSARLGTDDDTFGALNLYSLRRRRFTRSERTFVHVFAHHAAVALFSAERGEQLRTAIDHRTLIGQGEGILMERYDLDAQQAFAVLQRYSQDHNRKLYDVATALVTTRDLPDDDPGESPQPTLGA